MRLRRKIALVTGAAGGIGAATARRFAREGASVTVDDARAAGLARVVDELSRARRGRRP